MEAGSDCAFYDSAGQKVTVLDAGCDGAFCDSGVGDTGVGNAGVGNAGCARLVLNISRINLLKIKLNL